MKPVRLLAATTLALALGFVGRADAAPTHYVTLSDGVQIALNVKVPEKCAAQAPCPTYFEMSGYESGSDEGKTPLGHLADQTGIPFPLQTGTRAAHAAPFEQDYVTVLASVRGTGCSSGEFDLFSWRSAEDGREIIDDWIAKQPWSNGQVVIFGHSYSGLTGMFVAATRPRHLRAISASGLIGDLYRDIVYPGGVTNYGFPLLWTGAVRVLYDYGGGTIGGMYPVEPTSPQCAANQAERSRNVVEDPLVHGLDDTDSEWYRARSLTTWVERIEVPVHITAAYQDEQTGPRGPTYVFDRLSGAIPKRLVLVNGEHNTQTDPSVRRDRHAWIHYWMRGQKTANLGFASGETDVETLFGGTSSRVILGYQGGDRAVGELNSTGFPLAETEFTDLYVSGAGALSREPAEEAGSARWVNGSRRQSYSFQAGSSQGGEISSRAGPDEIELRTAPVTEPLTIAGPITASLFVSSTAPDTELFVQLIDRAPDGTLLYLQRGMLRGSHRDIDPGRSQYFGDTLYRPYRPHTTRRPVIPGTVTEYLLDIFPVGHVLLPGHRLVAKISAPPADDNDYLYVQKTLAGVNTLHFGPATPSRITLPLLAHDEVEGFTMPKAGQCPYSSMRCIKGSGSTSKKKGKKRKRKKRRR